MSIANYFNKLPEDAPLPILWKPSQQCGRYLHEVWQSQVEIEHYSVAYFDCITAFEADRSCSFPGSLTVVAFSLLHEASISLIRYTWYPQMTPDAEKERGIAVVVAISHYQRCLGHIMNVPQLYISAVAGNDDRPLLEPANPCDTTIRIEFPESDASLEISDLKCCILMQVQKGCIIKAPTVCASVGSMLQRFCKTLYASISKLYRK